MDIEQLKIFAEVMQQGSFTAVAKNRRVDPATISRAIKQLETSFDVRLFQRTTRKLNATPGARQFLADIQPLIRDFEAATLKLRESRGDLQGRLHISSPVSFAQMNLLPVIPIFANKYPNIRFDLSLSDKDPDLIEAGVDVAFRVGHLADSQFICIELCKMKTKVVCSPAFLESRPASPNPEDLLELPCLTLNYRGFYQNQWVFRRIDQLLNSVDPAISNEVIEETQTVEISSRLATSNAMALKQAALSGMGIALLAEWMIGPELAQGHLIDLFPDYEVSSAEQEASAWMLFPSREHMPQKLRVFIDFVRDQFRLGAPGARVR